MGSPPQTPQFQLPGAEYFSLAPNRTIALGGRRRQIAFTPSTPIPADSILQLNTSVLLETGFTQTAGIYLHDTWLLALPGDSSGENQILSTTMGLSLNANPATAAYQLGIPILTQITPGGGTIALRDQEKLITQRDISLAQTLIGPFVPAGSLFFTFDAFIKNNDLVSPHNFQLTAVIIYTRLDGFVE
jgi:hypothetical protein